MTRRSVIVAVLAVIGALAALVGDASAQERTLSLWKEGEQDCPAGWSVGIEWRAGEGARDASIEGQALEGTWGVVQVECGTLSADWKIWAARYGTLPTRVVIGQATSASGRLVVVRLRLRILPPLPAPTVEAAIGDVQDGTLLAAIDPASAGRSGVEHPWIAVRWREIGAEQWQVDAGRYGYLRGDRRGARFRAWLTAGEYELQAAVLRDSAEADRPDLLEWSEPPSRVTVEGPLDIVAEATHDTITVLLPDGLSLDNARYELHGPGVQYAVDTATSADRVTWAGLLPDEEYTLFAQRMPGGEAGSIVALQVKTEPAPTDQAAAPDSWGIVSGEAFPDRIELAWSAPAGAEVSSYDAEKSPYAVYVSTWGDGEPFSSGFAPVRETPYYLSMYRIHRRWDVLWVLRRIDVPAGTEHRVTVDDLRPGSTYVVHVVRHIATGGLLGSRLVLETPERAAAEPTLAAPPPPSVEYSAWPRDCAGIPDARFTLSVDESGDWDAVEYEWEVEGRRARWLREGSGRLGISQSRQGEHVFRVRGRRGDEWSAWSEPARAGPRPVLPILRGAAPLTEAGIRLTWFDSSGGPAPEPDWHVVRWSLDDGEPQEAVVRDAQEFVVPLAPDWEGRLEATVTGVHRDYGEGEPSYPTELDVLRQPLEVQMNLDSCRPLAGWPGRMGLAIEGGIAPYAVRAAGVEKVFQDNHRLQLEFDCGVVAGDGEVSWQVIDAAGTERSGVEPLEVIEFAEGGARQERPEWALAEAGRTDIRAMWHCLADPRQEYWYEGPPYVLRWRAAGEEAWRYQSPFKDRFASGEWLCWAELSGLQPGRAYEIEVAEYRDQYGMAQTNSLRWSEPITVRTVGERPIAQSVHDGERLVVSWARESDAMRYLIRVRGDGRSWWRLVHASGGELETAEFAVPFDGEYEVEVVPAPPIWGGFWPAMRPNRIPRATSPC